MDTLESVVPCGVGGEVRLSGKLDGGDAAIAFNDYVAVLLIGTA
jgi:hypothetical protein